MPIKLCKLGKLAPRKDKRNLKLANYLPALPPIPDACDWSCGITDWGMMLNSGIGDCTCAAAAHMLMQWTANAGVEIVPTDGSVLEAYSAITGYDPNHPDTDRGAIILDVLNYWRQTGIAGHKIGAYASVSPKNIEHIKASIYLFGGCYLGVALPTAWQGARIWDIPRGGLRGQGAPGSWGGHAVEAVSFSQTGMTVITWGQPTLMTWNAATAYMDEAYALISNDFLKNGKTPGGLDIITLADDLKAVTN